jgi:hypothetical protein
VNRPDRVRRVMTEVAAPRWGVGNRPPEPREASIAPQRGERAGHQDGRRTPRRQRGRRGKVRPLRRIDSPRRRPDFSVPQILCDGDALRLHVRRENIGPRPPARRSDGRI